MLQAGQRGYSQRSLQSTKRDRASPPMTRILLYWPVRMNWAAVISATTKPLQAAVMSKAMAFLAPRTFWTCQTTLC